MGCIDDARHCVPWSEAGALAKPGVTLTGIRAEPAIQPYGGRHALRILLRPVAAWQDPRRIRKNAERAGAVFGIAPGLGVARP